MENECYFCRENNPKPISKLIRDDHVMLIGVNGKHGHLYVAKYTELEKKELQSINVIKINFCPECGRQLREKLFYHKPEDKTD